MVIKTGENIRNPYTGCISKAMIDNTGIIQEKDVFFRLSRIQARAIQTNKRSLLKVKVKKYGLSIVPARINKNRLAGTLFFGDSRYMAMQRIIIRDILIK